MLGKNVHKKCIGVYSSCTQQSIAIYQIVQFIKKPRKKVTEDHVRGGDVYKREEVGSFLGYFRKVDIHEVYSGEWIPYVGKADGLLCGVKKEKFEIKSCEKGKYIHKLVLWDVELQTEWALLNVYGATHAEFKTEF